MQSGLILISMFMVGLICLAGLTSVYAKTEKINLSISGKGITGPYFPTTGSIAKHPYFTNSSDAETIGFKAALITTARVPNAIVQTVTGEVFENLNNFKSRDPASVTMTREDMTLGMVAPAHPGPSDSFKNQHSVTASLIHSGGRPSLFRRFDLSQKHRKKISTGKEVKQTVCIGHGVSHARDRRG